MTEKLHLEPRHREQLEALLRKHLPDVDAWAYGSRVSGQSHDGSDLDLVLRGPDLQEIAIDHLVDFNEALQKSTIPFLVEARDWARLPESFHREIKKKYVAISASLVGGPGSLKAPLTVTLGEWRKVKVSEVATPVIGGTPSRSVPEYWDGSISWATAKDVAAASGRYLEIVQERITNKGLEFSAAKLMPEGTVVITARGTVGALVQLRREMAFNQTCYALLPKDNLDNNFLFYVLKGTLAEMQALTYGTVFETITKRTFDNWLIPLPHFPEQRAIAHVLGTLDDKIELNRRMNETLEKMARALFKSWFVDFDPVHAKAALKNHSPSNSLTLKKGKAVQGGEWTVDRARAYLDRIDPNIAALFPDRFVDSELGEIPEGWEVKTLGDVVDQLRDTINPLDSPKVVFSHFSIPAYDKGQLPHQELGEDIKSIKSRTPSGAVLLSKLNPEIKRVWLVDVKVDERAICSTEFLVLWAKPPFNRSYVYCLVCTSFFQGQLQSLVTGTSKSHQRARADAIMKLKTVFPAYSVVQAFESAASKLLNRSLVCRQESKCLAALRDALLPKLVSGEIQVDTINVRSKRMVV